METAVVLKQMPDVSESKGYQDVGFLNESDKNVLVEALNLRDEAGGTVSVFLLGPDTTQSAQILMDALSMGVDRAFFVTDDKFRGQDVKGAAFILAKAVAAACPSLDLLLTGRQAVDGDSAHMLAMIAEEMEIPQIVYSKQLQVCENSIEAVRFTEAGDYLMTSEFPVAVSSIREKNRPRHSKVTDIMKAYSGEYKAVRLSYRDIFTEGEALPEKSFFVINEYEPADSGEKQIIWLTGKGDKESAANITSKLQDLSFI